MDQRKLPRHSVGGSIMAAVKNLLGRDAAGCKIIRAKVKDLSHDGAGLCVEVVSSQVYAAGNPIYIEIMLSNGSIIGSEGEVKWVKPLANHTGFHLGVQFKKIDNQDKSRLKRFLNELDKNLERGM